MSKIIKMALQAGMRFSTTGSPTVAIELVSGHVRELERFAALVAKAERERCANTGFYAAINGIEVSAAIRALGDEVGE